MINDTQQGVAQRVIAAINQVRRSRDPNDWYLGSVDDSCLEGAEWMLHDLSAEARAKLSRYEDRIKHEDDLEMQVVLSRKRDAVKDAYEELGLDLDGGDS